VKFYFSTAQREDVFNQQETKHYKKGVPLSSDLRNQVNELAQNYSFSEVGRRLRINKNAILKFVRHYSEEIFADFSLISWQR